MRASALSCRALLFDLDGVLVDSTARVEEAWTRWAHEHALDPEDVLRIAHGRRTVEVIAEVTPDLDVDQVATELERREEGLVRGLRTIDGARELLASLPDLAWAVVTSGTRGLASARLDAVGLPVPRVLVSANDVERGKPHPDGYLMAARLLDAAPSECVVFEDAPPGIAAALAAGMHVIALPTTYDLSDLADADEVVRSLRELRVHVDETDRTLRLERS